MAVNDESILGSVKKMLGLAQEDESFDLDLITHINSVLGILTQEGIGPEEGLVISDENSVWSDFISDSNLLQQVKSFVALKVKMIFDPPASSVMQEAYNANIKELEWRLYSLENFKKEEEPDEK